jgi:hypothetical protein
MKQNENQVRRKIHFFKIPAFCKSVEQLFSGSIRTERGLQAMKKSKGHVVRSIKQICPAAASHFQEHS